MCVCGKNWQTEGGTEPGGSLPHLPTLPHTLVHPPTCTQTHMYTNTQVHTCARTCTQTYMRTCIHTPTCTHMYTHAHMRVHTGTQGSVISHFAPHGQDLPPAVPGGSSQAPASDSEAQCDPGPRNVGASPGQGVGDKGCAPPGYPPGAAVASSARWGNTVRGWRLHRGTGSDSSPGAALLQEG